jgi:hypothetical protein
MFIFLNMFFISLVAMDLFYKSNAETDLASLHYVTFIFPMEALSFNSKQFTNNSMKKVIGGERNNPFLLLEEHLFAVILLYNKNYEVQFEELSQEVLKFFSEP